jgi:hypothetical protein
VVAAVRADFSGPPRDPLADHGRSHQDDFDYRARGHPRQLDPAISQTNAEHDAPAQGNNRHKANASREHSSDSDISSTDISRPGLAGPIARQRGHGMSGHAMMGA